MKFLKLVEAVNQPIKVDGGITMTNGLNLKLGDKFYNIDSGQKFTVAHEDKSAFYLAVFDGCCSKIEYVSKNAAVSAEKFPVTWFKFREEMLQQRIKNAEKTLQVEKNCLTRHLTRN